LSIDIFPHILPKAYFEKIQSTGPQGMLMAKRIANVKPLHDIDTRLHIMDEYENYQQVLTLGAPAIEAIAGPDSTPGLAQLGNDEMAKLCKANPEHFLGFVCSLPMNNPDAAIKELERSIDELGATGVQLYTNANGKPLDRPEFDSIFAKMAEAKLPIWLHPTRTPAVAEYIDEPRSYYDMWWAFGWPFETSVAMGRIVFSGMFDKYPDLSIITHHMGAMIPYFEGRVGPGLDALGERSDDPIDGAALSHLKKTPGEYFRMFYGDTALFGAVPAMRCGLDYFGADHVLFGTDMPFVGQISDTLDGIAKLDLNPEDRHAIMEGNARRLLAI
jgi:predicted TIM-barrel fold metal-dependent hydrolase